MTKQSNLVGNSNSFLLRPLRYLFEDGKTLPQLNNLWFQSPSSVARPFGVITKTDRGRVIFWPPLPPDVPMLSPDGKTSALDHITLELSNGKSHTTSFDRNGKRKHFRGDWVLHEVADSGLAQWFSMLVPWAIIEQQDLLLEVGVRMPPPDSARRTDEFKKYAQTTVHQPISLPAERSGDYVLCVFYLCTQDTFDFSLVQKNFLGAIDKNVTGFADGIIFPVGATVVELGTIRLLVATATPPGVAQNDVVFGFPTSHKPKQNRLDGPD